MKHTVYALLSAAALLTSGGAFAQNKSIPQPSKALKNAKVLRPVHNHMRSSELPLFPVQAVNPTVTNNAGRSFGPEVRIGQTLYDLQTNNSVNYRIENFGDGTLSALWTFSNQSTAWTDRGMAYHQFDGSAWTKLPDYNDAGNITRIEPVRTGFGSLARVNGVGDIVAAHQTTIDAIQVSRNTTTSGENWISTAETTMPLIWPRMRVGGSDGKTVHIIGLTEPSGGTFTGTPVHGINGCMLYNRSTDGGATWDQLMVQLPGVDSTIFASFGGDSYAMDVKGNTVAIVAGDITSRVMLWKSTDNGLTWSNRTVKDFPYEPWNDSILTDFNGDGLVDSFLVDSVNNVYDLERVETSDGSFSVIIDNNDKVHVTYGLGYMSNDDVTDGNVSYYPGANGIMYWNEDFAVDSLPQLIGGSTDADANGTLDVTIYFSDGTTVPYASGMAGYPSMGIDADGTLYLSYAAYIEGTNYLYLSTGPNFKHIYFQKSTDGGATWTDPKDIVGDELAGFDQLAEYQYASIARLVDNNVHVVYQRDYTPGCGVTINDAAIHPFDVPNDIIYMSITKDFDIVGMPTVKNEINGLALMPNPSNESATLKFDLNNSEKVSVNVVNMLGQRVLNLDSQSAAAGQHSINLGTNQLPSGIYLVNVTAGNKTGSVKMIVQH
jgi:hypothetical protein